MAIATTLVAAPGTRADDRARDAKTAPVRIVTVFDNYPVTSGLTARWGFAAVVVTADMTVLFDTGSNGAVLLANMRRLKLDPRTVRAVVISHVHRDHLGGLAGFLAANHAVTVYLPGPLPSVRRLVRAAGANVRTVHGPSAVGRRLYTTGPLGHGLKEQALVVDTTTGLVVMTGCAHPGIVHVLDAARAQHPDRPIALVMGGFHLRNAPSARVRHIIETFRRLGVKRVAPSHCTGNAARRAFEKAYGADYIAGGLGRVIELR